MYTADRGTLRIRFLKPQPLSQTTERNWETNVKNSWGTLQRTFCEATATALRSTDPRGLGDKLERRTVEGTKTHFLKHQPFASPDGLKLGEIMRLMLHIQTTRQDNS